MSQTGKLMPNLDRQGTKVLNLTVLQRIDPCIEEILLTAAHVTFYEFNIDLNQWSRKDVEGSLFVVKRSTQPRFQFIVMNRRNTDNLVENLLGDFEYEIQVPYLLYRNAAQEVNGIWFYNQRECEEVANLFSRILNAYSKVPVNTKGKSEFDELEAVPSVTAMEGSLEPTSASSNVANVAADSSFPDFFNEAMNLGNRPSKTGNPGQLYHSSPALSSSVNTSTVLPPSATLLQIPSAAGPAPAIPFGRPPDSTDPTNRSTQITNLIKPSSFYTPPVSSSPLTMPTISPSVPAVAPQPSLTLQRPYGTPLLQPFPPPTPPPSLTPNGTVAQSYGPVIDRDKVRDALVMLVQDNQFIDMVYQALQKAHHM